MRLRGPAGQPLDLFVTATDFRGRLQKLRLHSPAVAEESEHRLSIGFRYGSHICVDVINRVRAAWLRAFVRSSVFLLSLVFLVTVAWIGTDMAWRVRFQSFASVELSMTWAYAAIPVGAAFAAIALVAQFIAPSQDTPGQREFGGMACQE